MEPVQRPGKPFGRDVRTRNRVADNDGVSPHIQALDRDLRCGDLALHDNAGAGAFDGIEKIIEKRVSSGSLGFGNEVKSKKDLERSKLLKQLVPQDLIKFGLISSLSKAPAFVYPAKVGATKSAPISAAIRASSAVLTSAKINASGMFSLISRIVSYASLPSSR